MKWIILGISTLFFLGCGGGGGPDPGEPPRSRQFVEVTYSQDGCLIDDNAEFSYSMTRAGTSLTHKAWGCASFDGESDQRVDAVFVSDDECLELDRIVHNSSQDCPYRAPKPSAPRISADIEIHGQNNAGYLRVDYSGGTCYLVIDGYVINTGTLPLYRMISNLYFDGQEVDFQQQPVDDVAFQPGSGAGPSGPGRQWLITYNNYRGFPVDCSGLQSGTEYPVTLIVRDRFGGEIGRADATAVPSW